MTLILRSKNDPLSRRIMTGVIFLRRIMTPGHYSTGVIIRRYTGNCMDNSVKMGETSMSY